MDGEANAFSATATLEADFDHWIAELPPCFTALCPIGSGPNIHGTVDDFQGAEIDTIHLEYTSLARGVFTGDVVFDGQTSGEWQGAMSPDAATVTGTFGVTGADVSVIGLLARRSSAR